MSWRDGGTEPHNTKIMSGLTSWDLLATLPDLGYYKHKMLVDVALSIDF